MNEVWVVLAVVVVIGVIVALTILLVLRRHAGGVSAELPGARFSAHRNQETHFGIRARDLTSRRGSITIVDGTGLGADVEHLNAEKDLAVETRPPAESDAYGDKQGS